MQVLQCKQLLKTSGMATIILTEKKKQKKDF